MILFRELTGKSKGRNIPKGMKRIMLPRIFSITCNLLKVLCAEKIAMDCFTVLITGTKFISIAFGLSTRVIGTGSNVRQKIKTIYTTNSSHTVSFL